MDSPYFDSTYFDPAYFDADGASSGSGNGLITKRRTFRMKIEPPAEIVEVTDDGWIHILL